MKVEIIVNRMTDVFSREIIRAERGAVLDVDATLGRRWCDLGWARDVGGDYPTGTPVPAVTLEIQPGKHGTAVRIR